MKTLCILRHGKSSWDNTNIDDFSRPLQNKGIERTKKITSFINNNALIPDIIITSSAQRAISTANILANNLSNKTNIIVDNAFYNAQITDYIKTIINLPPKYNIALIVGHNPTLVELANYLQTMQTIQWIPTSALVVIEFKTKNWDMIEKAESILTHFVKPKSLK